MTARGKKKSKAKANPYATIKLWRPLADNSGVARDEEVFQDFTNFDLLMEEHALPVTGHLRQEEGNWTPGAGSASRAVGSFSVSSRDKVAATGAAGIGVGELGRWESPARDFSLGEDSPETERRAPAGRPRGRSPTRRPRQMAPSSPPQTVVNGEELVADYPRDPSPAMRHGTSLSSYTHDPDELGRSQAVLDGSLNMVSPAVSRSVMAILSKTYGTQDFDGAREDVERLLTQLKMTVEGLQGQTTCSDKQWQAVRQDLQLQTKEFVSDAKRLVASTSGPRELAAEPLHAAMHSLARLLLHSQAVMTAMRSVHHAQHVGFQVIKVTTAFKSTLAAGDAAVAKPRNDPHVIYLMRQAQYLAGLLSTLLTTLTTLQQGL